MSASVSVAFRNRSMRLSNCTSRARAAISCDSRSAISRAVCSIRPPASWRSWALARSTHTSATAIASTAISRQTLTRACRRSGQLRNDQDGGRRSDIDAGAGCGSRRVTIVAARASPRLLEQRCKPGPIRGLARRLASRFVVRSARCRRTPSSRDSRGRRARRRRRAGRSAPPSRRRRCRRGCRAPARRAAHGGGAARRVSRWPTRPDSSRRDAALRQRRCGTKRTSSLANTRSAPAALRWLPPAYRVLPSARRRRNAVSAPPSSRLMPIQSQPTEPAGRNESLHSWSSQARPATVNAASIEASVPRVSSCGSL